MIDLLKELAEKKGATPAQIALAWVMVQKPADRAHPRNAQLGPPSARTSARSNVALTSGTICGRSALALSAITVSGGRMNKEQMEQVDQTNADFGVTLPAQSRRPRPRSPMSALRRLRPSLGNGRPPDFHCKSVAIAPLAPYAPKVKIASECGEVPLSATVITS